LTSGTLTLSRERQSARMSKITNHSLSRYGKCTHMATVGVKGLTAVFSCLVCAWVRWN